MDTPLSSILALFPELTPVQIGQLTQLTQLFREWNERLNLVSRKDIEHFEEHHLLHSLLIAKCIQFPSRARVMDLGTGGGLPGLPLAILFPEAQFYLVDSITKKINAVAEMVTALGLKNAFPVNKRAELLESKFDYVIGRAVAPLPEFAGWVRYSMRTRLSFIPPEAPPDAAKGLPVPGILYLKGSLYHAEVAQLGVTPVSVYDLATLTTSEYFKDKYLVHLSARDVLNALPPPEPTPTKKRR
ncbi:MAG: 16S rRNA (guanine(527)-N(7))-methyltransferase RsmG [Verrucomicrobiota bacterium]|nr:16S rRNA (guanine(527)-N(7))-methyltransferase RsmG [Verrucomicrobiota bacterium]